MTAAQSESSAGSLRCGAASSARYVLVALLLAAPVSAAQTADKHLAKADAALSDGRFAKARSAYERALKADGDSIAAVEGLARTNLALFDNERAERYARLLLEGAATSDQRFLANLVLGSALYFRSRDGAFADEDKLVESESCFREVLRLSGGSFNDARISLAEVLLRLDRLDEGREIIAEYFELGASPPTRSAAENLRCILDVDVKRLAELGDVSRPIMVRSTAPQYTDLARQQRLMGTVTIEAIIDEEGRVRCARVLKGLPLGLTAAAMGSVKDWRYEPAMSGAEAVAVRFNVSIRFVLR